MHSQKTSAQAWKDLKKHNVSDKDFVLGIAASGTTPYVVSGIKDCNKNNIPTGCITNLFFSFPKTLSVSISSKSVPTNLKSMHFIFLPFTSCFFTYPLS